MPPPLAPALATDRWLILCPELLEAVLERAAQHPDGFAALRVAAGHVESAAMATLEPRLTELLTQDWHTLHVVAPTYDAAVWDVLALAGRGSKGPGIRLSCLLDPDAADADPLAGQALQRVLWLDHLDEPDFAVMDRWLTSGRRWRPSIAGGPLTQDWIDRYMVAFERWQSALEDRLGQEFLDGFNVDTAQPCSHTWLAGPDAPEWRQAPPPDATNTPGPAVALETAEARSNGIPGGASAGENRFDWTLDNDISITASREWRGADVHWNVHIPRALRLDDSTATLRLTTTTHVCIEPGFIGRWEDYPRDAPSHSTCGFEELADPDGTLWSMLQAVVMVRLTIDPAPAD